MLGDHATESEAETEALGAALWKTLHAPGCVLLEAPLGTGKTTLVRGLLRAAGHEGAVPSPTYAIVQPYEGLGGGAPPLYHLDLYRLNSASELAELGLDDMLDHGIVLAEWPERAAGWWPQDALRVAGTMLGDGRRSWRIGPDGPGGSGGKRDEG